MTNRAVMQQALECIERLNMRGFILADFEDEVESAINALREALEQPALEPVAWVCYGAPGKRDIDFEEADINGLPIGTNLYTTPPAAQPKQEPVAWNVIDPAGNILATEKNAIRGWARVNGYKPTVEGLLGLHELGWRVLPTSPPAAQPPPEWVGLTEEELQFYIKKHSKLVNAGYDKATDTNLVAKTFDSTAFYKEVLAVLKERNHD